MQFKITLLHSILYLKNKFLFTFEALKNLPNAKPLTNIIHFGIKGMFCTADNFAQQRVQ